MWVIHVRKHDTLVKGGSVETVFVCEPDDGQGCVPKLLLSDLNAAKQPDKPLFPFFFSLFFR